MPKPAHFRAGRIVRPHGITGEVKVDGPADVLEALASVRRVYLGEERSAVTVEACRFHQGSALLRLAGVADRNAAEGLRGRDVYLRAADLPVLPEGEYYAHDLVGLRVVDDAGQDLGELAEVLATGANDVYVVRTPDGERLLPAIESVVRRIDLDQGVIVVTVPPGL